MLKVLHISTSIVPQSAAWRIHNALLKNDIDSYIYVLEPSYENYRIMYGEVEGILGKIVYKIRWFWGKRFARMIRSFLGSTNSVPISLGIGSMLDREFIRKINPDVINLHWICGEFISTKDLVWLSSFPLVWTLHDSWPFTGGCHVPQECRKWEKGCDSCKFMGRRMGFDLAKYIFNRKKKYYSKLDIKIIGASEWIAECARKSDLFKDKDVFCVHNTLNQNLFKPKEKKVVREMLGLPIEKKIVLFGAVNSTSNTNKGFDLLFNAIRCLVGGKMGKECELMVFGSDEPDDHPDFGVPVHYMGRFYDNLSLSILYSAADVMIVPSRSETFPNTVLESINCGTPVVAFNIGGIPDQIEHKVNGYLATPYDSYDLAKGIEFVLSDEDRWHRMSQAAREKATRCFNEKLIAAEMLNVYKKAIMDNGGKCEC